MLGVREEIHSAEKYRPLPIEDRFTGGRENTMADGFGGGFLGVGRSIWGAGNHHPELAVPEWAAGEKAARADDGRVGADPRSAG